VDQHLLKRNRQFDLVPVIASHPELLGIGIDEDTAAVIRDGRLTVVGRGSVTIVDGQHLVSKAYEAKRTAPLLVSGAILHVLPAGNAFDLTTRSLAIFATAEEDLEVEELRAAEADLRGLAREIAAEGVSPTDYARHLRRTRRA
jgi:cyanophycinase